MDDRREHPRVPPGTGPPHRLDVLLERVNAGESGAVDEFFPEVYDTLRGMARRAMGASNREHTLQPTALVNEAWLRMFGERDVRWNGREHFLKVAAIAMRRVLVDHARRKRAGKRIPRERFVDLDQALIAFEDRSIGSLIDLDDALRELEAKDPELAQFATLRFFGGRTIEEASQILGLEGTRGIMAWRAAKAWLRQRLER
jgi:RNA polymerase sigma factor (TIGR02999 family)